MQFNDVLQNIVTTVATEHLAHFVENTDIYHVSVFSIKIQTYDFWSRSPSPGVCVCVSV